MSFGGRRRKGGLTSKRVILLTQWFEPEPTVKGLAFARELVRRGYSIEVVTGFPNYPEGVLYPGHRMSWRHQAVIEGALVTRLPLYPSHDSSSLKRIANYVSFAISATVYCLFQAKRADIVYVYQLPTLGVVARLIRAFRGSRVVFDIADMWPDTLRATGMVNSSRVLSAVGWAALTVYQQADAVVATTPGFRLLLLERGLPPEKVTVVYNWSDEHSLGPPMARRTDAGRSGSEFRIVFAGNLGKAQGLQAVLKAAEILSRENSTIRFVFVGSGVEAGRLKKYAHDRRLVNVEFVARVTMDRIGPYLSQADALLVHLKADPLFTITIPGKTQTYMAMGKPMLMATCGDAATLVQEARCGVEATPQDPESIAAAARKLASLPAEELVAMGKRARDYYDNHLALSVGVDRFVSVFESLSAG